MDQVKISTYTDRIHDIECPKLEEVPTLESIEASPTRCPHPETAAKMESRILEAKKAGDSVGGTIMCRVNGLPIDGENPFLTGSKLICKSHDVSPGDQRIRNWQWIQWNFPQRLRTQRLI